MRRGELILGFFFTSFLLFGFSFSRGNSWNLLFGSIGSLLVFFISLGAGTCILGVAVHALVSRMAAFGDSFVSAIPSAAELKKYRGISLLIILLGYLPGVIIYFPGCVPYDGMTQLLEHFGKLPHYGHHPVFITRLYGILVQAGASLHSYNLGVFFVIALQVILCAIAFSSAAVLILELGFSKKTFYAVSLFYALFPVFGAAVCSVMKDVFYMAAATLFIATLIRILLTLRSGDGNNISSFVKLFICMFFMCISRNEAIYCLVPVLIGLFACSRDSLSKKRVAACGIGVIVLLFAYNFLVFTVLAVPKGEIAEMLSIPFQQTARYVRDAGESVTKKERSAIDAVLPYDQLAECYDEELSDPVKGKMRSGCGGRDYVNYALTWAKMGLKRPDIYLQATINNVYGYFYPFYKTTGIWHSAINQSQTDEGEGFDISFVMPEGVRNAFSKMQKLWQKIPVLRLILNTGVYTWSVIICMYLAIMRKDLPSAVPLILLLMMILVCVAGPLNGHARYFYAIYAASPLTACYALSGSRAESI